MPDTKSKILTALAVWRGVSIATFVVGLFCPFWISPVPTFFGFGPRLGPCGGFITVFVMLFAYPPFVICLPLYFCLSVFAFYSILEEQWLDFGVKKFLIVLSIINAFPLVVSIFSGIILWEEWLLYIGVLSGFVLEIVELYFWRGVYTD